MFPRIFSAGHEETSEDRSRPEDSRRTKEGDTRNEKPEERVSEPVEEEESQAKSFNQVYWSQMMISTVSHEYLCSWDECCKLPIIEFLNVYSFVVTRKQRELDIQRKALHNIKH